MDSKHQSDVKATINELKLQTKNKMLMKHIDRVVLKKAEKSKLNNSSLILPEVSNDISNENKCIFNSEQIDNNMNNETNELNVKSTPNETINDSIAKTQSTDSTTSSSLNEKTISKDEITSSQPPQQSNSNILIEKINPDLNIKNEKRNLKFRFIKPELANASSSPNNTNVVDPLTPPSVEQHTNGDNSSSSSTHEQDSLTVTNGCSNNNPSENQVLSSPTKRLSTAQIIRQVLASPERKQITEKQNLLNKKPNDHSMLNEDAQDDKELLISESRKFLRKSSAKGQNLTSNGSTNEETTISLADVAKNLFPIVSLSRLDNPKQLESIKLLEKKEKSTSSSSVSSHVSKVKYELKIKMKTPKKKKTLSNKTKKLLEDGLRRSVRLRGGDDDIQIIDEVHHNTIEFERTVNGDKNVNLTQELNNSKLSEKEKIVNKNEDEEKMTKKLNTTPKKIVDIVLDENNNNLQENLRRSTRLNLTSTPEKTIKPQTSTSDKEKSEEEKRSAEKLIKTNGNKKSESKNKENTEKIDEKKKNAEKLVKPIENKKNESKNKVKTPKKKLKSEKSVDLSEKNKTIDNDEGIRRSGRVKVAPGDLKPIYTLEVLTDFSGKSVCVSKISGYEKINNDLSEFRRKFLSKSKNTANTSKRKDLKTNDDHEGDDEAEKIKEKSLKRKTISNETANSAKKIKKLNNDKTNSIDHSITSTQADETVKRLESVSIGIQTLDSPIQIKNTQSSQTEIISPSSSVEKSDLCLDLFNNPEYNHNEECIRVEDSEKSVMVQQHIVRFERMCDKKEFTELTKGVFASAIGNSEGMIKIEATKASAINEHDSDIQYFIQRGTVVLKLNEQKILLNIGDSVIVPKFNKYELFNPLNKSSSYLLFRFEKL